jgi:hypothetical protein
MGYVGHGLASDAGHPHAYAAGRTPEDDAGNGGRTPVPVIRLETLASAPILEVGTGSLADGGNAAARSLQGSADQARAGRRGRAGPGGLHVGPLPGCSGPPARRIGRPTGRRGGRRPVGVSIRVSAEVGLRELLSLRAEQAVRELVNRDHAAARRSRCAEQPRTDADQQTRLHRHILAARTLSGSKEGHKVLQPLLRTTQITD